jgi:hypothetical protein
MADRRQWLRRRVVGGSVTALIGLALFAASLVAQAANPDANFDFRIVGGVGIGLAAAGLSVAIRFGVGLRDSSTGRRIVAEELDERYVSMRQRAGARAYWVSALMVFGGLMWTSWASNGKLQPLEGDFLWNFLALATVVPFLVYAASLIVDERNA